MENKLGILKCSGKEENISFEVYMNSDFLYTIVVKNEKTTLTETHQGVRAIFGADALDVQTVNFILDDMINKLKQGE